MFFDSLILLFSLKGENTAAIFADAGSPESSLQGWSASLS